MAHDAVFEMAGSSVRFGAGATAEVGFDLADAGLARALVVIDAALRTLPPAATLFDSLARNGVTAVVYDGVRVEPSDASWRDAIGFAGSAAFDAIVALGGGSTIDTAKAVNLYTAFPPADFLDYVNPPVGKGLPVPGPLKPLMAIPTTAGTGSETTGVCIMDVTALGVKTGISSRRLKPALGYLDPENTRTLPREVAAASGLDVLCHAVESYTALPFTGRERPVRPSLRAAYQGANPISDVWSLQALRMVSQYLLRAVADPEDEEARANMLLAAAYAGIGFGNAGVHLPHAMSYPVAGRVRDYRPTGYRTDHALVPHGLSVILNAPAAFRFTGPALPDRHLAAAEALGADVSRAQRADAGRVLAERIVWFMHRLGVPNGLRAIGYSADDIPALVEGAILQRRLTALSPREARPDDLAAMFEDALVAW